MSGGEYEILLKELLPFVQKEFDQIGEIRRITQELTEALGSNDQVTVKMLLKMRGDAMVETEKALRAQKMLRNACKDYPEKLDQLLAGDPGVDEENLDAMEKRIFTLKRAKKEALKKTIEADRMINKRLTGNRSFYEK